MPDPTPPTQPTPPSEVAAEEPAATAPRVRNRIRPRAAVVVLMALAVVASGLALDRAVGPRAVAQAVVEDRAQSGAWFCPHGGGAGWQGWVAMANPGERPVRIRLTDLAEGGARSVSTFSVGPGRLAYREVSAQSIADSTEVEFFGGWVGVSAVVRAPGSAGVTAGRCQAAGAPVWYLLDQPTTAGQASYVVVMNPFDQIGSFDLSFATELRSIAPSEFEPLVLQPHSSTAVRVNQFALAGASENTVTATVTQVVGRVIVGGLVVGVDGVRMDPGVAGGRTTSILPAAKDAGSPELLLQAVGEDRSDLSVVSSGRSEERVVSGSEQVSLAQGEVRTMTVVGLPNAGVVVEVSNGEPVAAALRLRGVGGQLATIAGDGEPGSTWMVMPTVTPDGGESYLILQNAGQEVAAASVRLIGLDGDVPSARLASVQIQPGRTLWFRLSRASHGRPVAALVTATSGTLVAAGASYPQRGGFAAALGVPMKS